MKFLYAVCICFMLVVPAVARESVNMMGPTEVVEREISEASDVNLVAWLNATKSMIEEQKMTKPPYNSRDWRSWKARLDIIFRNLYLLKTEMDIRDLHIKGR